MVNALATHAPVNTAESAPENKRLARLLMGEFDLVWRFLLRLGVEPARVQDEAQRVFQIARDKLPRVQEGRERSFLLAVAVRVAANARRSQQRHREDPIGDDIHLLLDKRPSVEELVDLKRRRELLDLLLDHLSLEQRTVLVLSEFEGMSRQEIAQHLGLPGGTVASRLRLAKRHFARHAARLHAELSEARNWRAR